MFYSNIQISYCVHSLKDYILIEFKNYDFISLIKNCSGQSKAILLKLKNDDSASKLSSLNTIVTLF